MSETEPLEIRVIKKIVILDWFQKPRTQRHLVRDMRMSSTVIDRALDALKRDGHVGVAADGETLFVTRRGWAHVGKKVPKWAEEDLTFQEGKWR